MVSSDSLIEIINHMFPKKTTLEQMKQNMPEGLYNELSNFYEGNIKKLTESLDVFKNENGEISEEKLTEYFSNSDVYVHPGTNLEYIFEHINPDSGIDKIQSIIAGRMQYICKHTPVKSEERKCSNYYREWENY